MPAGEREKFLRRGEEAELQEEPPKRNPSDVSGPW
jgi:hypothetical protein